MTKKYSRHLRFDSVTNFRDIGGYSARGGHIVAFPLFATDDRLAAALESAGADEGERLWRMPLVEDYRSALDSPVADLRHVPGDAKVGGGAITAALFLREFTAGRRWAHLDIAGTGRAEKDEHEISRGATGFGARLLLRWLETLR